LSLPDQFYEFAFEQLPFDDEVYVVVDVFDVNIERSTQPRWSVKLALFGKRGEKRRFRTYNVHGTFLHKFALGELFQNQCHVGNNRQEWAEILKCDLSNQNVVFRQRRKDLIFSSKRKFPSDIPYVKIPLLGNAPVDFAFVRCHEVFRFYYGPRLSILEYIFEFTDSGRNPKLYNAAKTYLSKTGEVHIFTGSRVHQLDAGYLGNYIYDPRNPKAIARPAISARVQSRNSNFQFIQPIVLAPIWFPSQWEVDGHILDYQEEGKQREGLMISCIRSCNVDPPFKVKDYNPSPKKKNPPQSDPDFTKRRKKQKLKRSKITNEPFGDDIEDTTPVRFNEFVSQPGFTKMDYTKVLQGEKDDRTGQYKNVDDNGNDKSSTSNQGGGSLDIDRHNPTSGRPANSNYEEEEEPDRSHLPSLLDIELDQFIEGKILPSKETPWAINRLKRVVRYLNKHTELRAFMLGDETGELGEDKTAVLTMPNEWLSQSGKPTYNSALGAVVIAQYRNHYFYFFELVKNFEKHHFMQAMYFRHMHNRKRDIEEFSTIFYEKLKGRNHWPQRKEFSDDFYAARLKHRKDETTNNFAGRMRDYAINYLLAEAAA